MIKVTKKQLEDRIKTRSPEYLDDIRPAMVKKYADGSMDFNDQHPAWIAAMEKYRPVRNKPISVGKSPCKYAVRDCCGKPYICSVDGGDCPDRFNDECVKRNK